MDEYAMLYCLGPTLPFAGGLRKIGSHLDDTIENATAALLTRYRTSYGPGTMVIKHIIFVATRGTHAEREVERRLAEFHWDGELYAGADVTRLDDAIAVHFAAMSVDRDNAHRQPMSDNKIAKRTHDDELKTKLDALRIERQATEEQKRIDAETDRLTRAQRSADEGRAKQQAAVDKVAARRQRTDRTDEQVDAWILAHIHRDDKGYVRIPKIWSEFQKMKLEGVKRETFVEKALLHMREGRHVPKCTTREGATVNNIVDGYTLTTTEQNLTSV